jgi:flagellar M-ring protein FliF
LAKLFGSLIIQFREFFKSLGPTKRVSMIASIAIVAVTLVVLTVSISGKDYQVLLTGVPSEQLSLIVEKLNQKNVPFQLRDDGKTITVPKDLLHSTQMTLMSEVGSTRLGSVGFEIFEKQDFSANSYQQKVNYQRALQGELMRSVNTLSSVKQSKILLAIPAKKNFLEETTPPTASVVVELYPGKTLAQDQIRGIRYLVASAVEGLDPEKVTVVDDRGKMLSRNTDGTTGGSSDLLELKAKVESDLEERIEAILGKVVGQGKIIARVDATLNNKVTQSVEESVDPDRTAIRSQQSDEESLDGSRTNPSGVPGSRANIPGAQDANQVGFKQDVKKESKSVNFEVPKSVKNIKEAAGSLEKISVAVLVDGFMTNTKKEDGTTESKWTARSTEELVKYETLVKNAVGFNLQRGDSVKIENIQFLSEDFTEADKILTSLERKNLLNSLFKWAALICGLILIFFVVIRPFMQWITDSFQDTVEDMLPRTIEELEELQTVDNTLPGMSSVLPILQESIDPDKAEAELLKDRINGIMETDNEKAQAAFNMWVAKRE